MAYRGIYKKQGICFGFLFQERDIISIKRFSRYKKTLTPNCGIFRTFIFNNVLWENKQ